MNRKLWLVAVVLLAGCAKPLEHSGPGQVISVDWHNRTFVFRAQNHHVKAFAPLCWYEGGPPAMPIWEGMKVEDIEFVYRRDMITGCYEIQTAEEAR